ncbi:MAG: glycosyltransferase [Bacteroidaceae bacterium]|nr:glycosyltransferase [Bacteroidaceae bacterium]MBP3834258.1 glycosyltransferase [Bacteroidaceae bacterium]
MNEIVPTFSIITVTYNAAATIEATLLSVRQQTYRHFEHLIIDGASKDNTLYIIYKYKDDTIKVFSEPDKGLYDAMNKGIRMASCDYLCFLNAGDTFHEVDTLEKIANTISTTPHGLPSIIYGETAIVNAERQFLHMRRHKAPDVLTWKSFQQGMLVCHQAFLVKRTLAEPYNLQYKYSSDFDWCIRMMKKADVISNTHLILIDYLDEGMTTRHHKESLIERLRIMAKHYGWCKTIIMHLWFAIRLLR